MNADGDLRFMRRALLLARKAEGSTSPNPIVGCCIVKKGSIVGEGYHERAGWSHAEVNALAAAGKNAGNATMYVTLEPCDHFGKTPPCTGAIVESGISRVVVAMKDPNPLNNGRGVRRLRSRGISVDIGLLGGEARAINKPYIKFITTGMPYVTVKVAESLDGKIATARGDSRWISGPDARVYVHELRSKVDAVMVGGATARHDDPLLTARPNGVETPHQPARVVVDSGLSLSLTSRLMKTAGRAPVVIAANERAPLSRRELFERRGAKVIAFPGNKNVDLEKLLRTLAASGMTNILVEGGGEVVGTLVEKGLVDRFLFFISPLVIGGRDAKTPVEGRGFGRISDALRVKRITLTRFKDDILIEGEVI